MKTNVNSQEQHMKSDMSCCSVVKESESHSPVSPLAKQVQQLMEIERKNLQCNLANYPSIGGLTQHKPIVYYDGLGVILATDTATPLRKARRLEILISVFNEASAKHDICDIGDLKHILINEKNKLLKMLQMSLLPLFDMYSEFSSNKNNNINNELQFQRSVICCNLLTSSLKMLKLFELYITQGISILSYNTFLSISEEMFRELSDIYISNNIMYDNAILLLKNVSNNMYINHSGIYVDRCMIYIHIIIK
jgi:hypothetical protein